MARVLTSAPVVVPFDDQPEFIATLGELARRLAGRGQHLWLFRNRDLPDLLVEFTEGSDAGTHRDAGPADAEEQRLEARLRLLGQYDLEARRRWDAVPLE